MRFTLEAEFLDGPSKNAMFGLVSVLPDTGSRNRTPPDSVSKPGGDAVLRSSTRPVHTTIAGWSATEPRIPG